jgi:hypothetical protein
MHFCFGQVRWNRYDMVKVKNGESVCSVSQSAPFAILFIYTMSTWTMSEVTYGWMLICLFVFGTTASRWARASFMRFSRSHNNAPQLVGLLWTSDQLIAETSTWQHTTLNRHPCPSTPVGFEPTISAGRPPQTYAFDCLATETGRLICTVIKCLSPAVHHDWTLPVLTS